VEPKIGSALSGKNKKAFKSLIHKDLKTLMAEVISR